MKAQYASDRDGGPVVYIDFKDSEFRAAERAGNYLVDTYGFEWLDEDLGMITVGASGWTIKEMRELWKEAKQATK